MILVQRIACRGCQRWYWRWLWQVTRRSYAFCSDQCSRAWYSGFNHARRVKAAERWQGHDD